MLHDEREKEKMITKNTIIFKHTHTGTPILKFNDDFSLRKNKQQLSNEFNRMKYILLLDHNT